METIREEIPMTKYYCDRCNKEVDISEGDYKTINLDTGSDLFYLLCDLCWDKVVEFIEGETNEDNTE